ncbi:MAG: alpha/beta hydrolase domain-containing protein [Gemmatimonadales bacterium]
MRARILTPLLAVSAIVGPATASAEVVRIEIVSREDILDGRDFGPFGPYEKLVGKVYFAFDPANPMNTRIVDLDKAPRNAAGFVEAWANFVVLRPKRIVPGGGVALLEVSNRGGKASLSYFNGAARSLDPVDPEHFGDGLLMRLGLTVIWVGWQHDVPLREGLLRLHVPVATGEDGQPLEGLVRADWVVDRPTRTLHIGHRNHVAYPVTDRRHPDNVLTVRDGRLAPRRVVPREDWQFAREVGDTVAEDATHVFMESGFQVGKIYELVYRARDPKVVGLGLAAIRDMIAYAKHDPSSPFPVRRGIAIGISQTGRFLRHFLYQGFNTDEQGRKAFDGLMIHTAGAGRGSFNHRFAQPSRDAHRYSAFFYPTDIFPFSSRTQTDPLTGDTDGLFAHQHDDSNLPYVFYTNAGYEYWGRAAGLVTTSVDARSDIELFPNERFYHLASGQHFVGQFPPPAQSALPNADAYRGNPLNFLVTMRALLSRMVEWVRDGAEPPASAYPRIDAGTLVRRDEVNFPAVPGVDFPGVAHEAYRVDYGPRWPEGIIDFQPPKLGPAVPTLVPQVDMFGNELGGVESVEILAPLATYTPWNLRTGFAGGTEELIDFRGTYIPLPVTEMAREAAGDPRPSIESLYSNKQAYLEIAERAARSLVESGTLLEEDVARVVRRASDHWDWVMAH